MDSQELESAAAEIERQRRPQAPVRDRDVARDEDQPLSRLAGTLGNAAFTQFVGRMRDGEGILTGGVVHPDIEGAIAAMQGRGRSLDLGVSERAGAALGDSFGDVRVHTGEHAAALSRAVAARAFTVGSDIFFDAGEYRPGTRDGDELLTHELAHVVQQRGAPRTGSLVVSRPGEARECEADAAARGL
jgi:hypothetical protein